MNNLTLTSEHRSKLVRITSFILYDYDVGMNGDILWFQHKTDEAKHGKIHWLEQVMFHLAKKIFEKDEVAIMTFLAKCCTDIPKDESLHPINYMYERYMRNKETREKQLKLNL